jgi:hypothetical protein
LENLRGYFTQKLGSKNRLKAKQNVKLKLGQRRRNDRGRELTAMNAFNLQIQKSYSI